MRFERTSVQRDVEVRLHQSGDGELGQHLHAVAHAAAPALRLVLRGARTELLMSDSAATDLNSKATWCGIQ